MIVNDPKKCCYCGGCVGVCPKAAITLKETRIEIDHEKCIECSSCVLICPVDAMKKVDGKGKGAKAGE
ncbi:MAG: 4Fe-4S binding protein [Candidatus Diapherotrites archaeon]|nr:4Fe-4S binding protein [Candidatus Micrarchaeota archaeon]MBU1939361.1 4Fe-4S binding protein [Candidatus Micrarchaeota archaeon]